MATIPFVVAGGNCSGLPSRVCVEGVSARHINGRGSLTSVSQQIFVTKVTCPADNDQYLHSLVIQLCPV